MACFSRALTYRLSQALLYGLCILSCWLIQHLPICISDVLGVLFRLFTLSFESHLSAWQELDSAVDMDVDLPARMGFPMLPRVPIRRLADDVQQQDGRSIVNLSAASQQRLPRLVLVVDTNVLICSVARRVVATIGKLLRPVSKQASASGTTHLSFQVPRTARSTTFSQGLCTLCCLAHLVLVPHTCPLEVCVPSRLWSMYIDVCTLCDKRSQVE